MFYCWTAMNNCPKKYSATMTGDQIEIPIITQEDDDMCTSDHRVCEGNYWWWHRKIFGILAVYQYGQIESNIKLIICQCVRMVSIKGLRQ